MINGHGRHPLQNPDELIALAKSVGALAHVNGFGQERQQRALSFADALLLHRSAISASVVEDRYYWTATEKAELKNLGFSDVQCRVPALVIPIRDVRGEIALHQIRPEDPRAGRDGRLRKYEIPNGATMTLDIPPAARAHLSNPNRPLFITEGPRKADSAVSHGLCCVDPLGVWGWRGTNEQGGKVALAAWESIALNDRPVYIVFDSDVMTKESVYKALVRLKAFLESRGALVKVIYLEPRMDGGKVGLDDFFAAGGYWLRCWQTRPKSSGRRQARNTNFRTRKPRRGCSG